MNARTNEETLDLFCDLLEPMGAILSDPEIRLLAQRRESNYRIAASAIRAHKQEVIQVLALLDGVPPSEYKVSLIALPLKLVRLLNMPEVQELFTGAEPMTAAGSFGSATDNIKDGAV